MIKYNHFINSHSSQMPLLRIWSAKVPLGARPFNEHSHTNFEIAYFISGGGTYIVKNKSYQFSAGDVFVFSSNEQHCITNVTGEQMEYIAIHFDPKYLWGNSATGLSENNINFCFLHNPDFENKLPRDNPATEKIIKMILAANEEIINKKLEYKLMVKSYINEITVTLLRELNYALPHDSSTAQHHAKEIISVINYIDKHLESAITLDDIAKQATMSPNYFCTVFKKINNITIWDYIVSKRCDLASQLLISNPELNIIDIAEKCGFNNTANFNKAFKKRIGTTPSHFRKNSGII